MCPRRAAVAVGLFVAVMPGGDLAGQADTPRAVAEEFFARLERTDWDGAAALVRPASRQRLRDIAMVSTYMQYATEDETGSGGTTMDDVPGPAEVSRYASRRLYGLEGVHTYGELAALSPEAFLARWFRSLDAELGISGIPRVVVEAVVEGDSLAHVLYRPHYAAAKGRGRMELGNARPLNWSVEVLTLRRVGRAWRAYLNDELVFHSPLMQIRTEER